MMVAQFEKQTATYGPAMIKILNACPEAIEQSNGWWSNPDNPTFDFREDEDGHVSIHSWTGRTQDEILAMIGLKVADIYPRGYKTVHVRAKIDVLGLAHAKCIPWQFLYNLGLQSDYKYKGRNYVKIPYFNADGTQHTKIKVRKAIEGEYKHCWDENTPGELIPYGLHKLDMALKAGYVPIGEGETDGWACWYNKVPYLGIPGANMQKTLKHLDMNQLPPKVYILLEPDQKQKLLDNGQSFYKNVHQELRKSGYKGEIFCIDFQRATGYKDPSELHIALWKEGKIDQFQEIFHRAIEQAIPANDTPEDYRVDKDEVTAKITSAIECKNVEELYKLTSEIIQLLPIEQEIIIGTVKSGMDKCKAFSMSAFKKFMKEAAKLKQAEEYVGIEALPEYERTDTGMVYNSEIHGPVTLSNFTAEITSDIKIDDGVERTRIYELEAELYGRHFSFEVPAKDLDKCGWVDQELGARARVSAGNSIKAHLANAIKATSEPEEKDQYAHTGWRKIDNQWIFLHNGSCLGQVGQVTSKNRKDLTKIYLFDKSALQALLERERESNGQVGQVGQVNIQASVRLSGSLSSYAFPCERENLQQAIRSSLKFTELASDVITMPLYSALWRSVLGEVEFGMHLAGQTGWGKSELCALIQQHLGARMHAKNLPGSWESTENSLEMLLFQAKDVPVVIDDFKPKGSKADQDRLHAKADRVFRQIGNRSSRGRLDGNLQQRAARSPRCLVISTGEDIPRGQSLKARGIVLTMDERITKGEASKKLLDAQREARQGLYAQAMAGYVEWLAPKIEALQAEWSEIVADERDGLRIDGHARSPENTANLILGMKCFLQYAYEMDAITEQEAQDYLTRCKVALIRIADEASQEDRQDRQSEHWRRLIATALTSNRAHLVTPSEDNNPGSGYGWIKSTRYIERDNELYPEDTFRPGGEKIGWVDEDNIYLDPKAAYAVAKTLGSSDLVTLETTLRKFLHQDGLLATTELTSRKTYTVRRKLGGVRRDVLHIKRQTLFPDDPPIDSVDQVDQLDQEPSQSASEESSASGQVNDPNPDGSSSKVDQDPTHIPNEDMRAIPQEYRDLLVRYQQKVFSLKSPTPMWVASDNGFRNTMFGKNEHIAFTKSLLRSGEDRKVKAAIEAMQRTLGEYGEEASA